MVDFSVSGRARVSLCKLRHNKSRKVRFQGLCGKAFKRQIHIHDRMFAKLCVLMGIMMLQHPPELFQIWPTDGREIDYCLIRGANSDGPCCAWTRTQMRGSWIVLLWGSIVKEGIYDTFGPFYNFYHCDWGIALAVLARIAYTHRREIDILLNHGIRRDFRNGWWYSLI